MEANEIVDTFPENSTDSPQRDHWVLGLTPSLKGLTNSRRLTSIAVRIAARQSTVTQSHYPPHRIPYNLHYLTSDFLWPPLASGAVGNTPDT